MVWRNSGREGIAARIREHLRLAKLFETWLREDNRVEILAPVTMGVVCFAPNKSQEQADVLCGELVDRLNATGQAYLMQRGCAR